MSDAFERAAERAEEEVQRRKRERAARGNRTGFRIHATVFVAVQLMLVAVWAATGFGYPWFVFPLFGWGVGLAAHYAAVRDSIRGP
ncbi:MAG: 2TM domain-containing protein [Thermoleophilaceae bacterium]|jgi:hypothetical protein